MGTTPNASAMLARFAGDPDERSGENLLVKWASSLIERIRIAPYFHDLTPDIQDARLLFACYLVCAHASSADLLSSDEA